MVLAYVVCGRGVPAPGKRVPAAHGGSGAQLPIAEPQGGVDLGVSACATVPGNPCAPFLLHEIDSSGLAIRVLQGDGQSVAPGSPCGR